MSRSACLWFLLVLFKSLLICVELNPLNIFFGWKQIDYKFPNNEARLNAIRTGAFVPGNTLPIDIQIVHKRVFITTPNWKEGIPATLSTVPLYPEECNYGKHCAPLLRPFPDWSWNNRDGNCAGLTSVFRINTDQCGRLWVLDSGVINYITKDKLSLCPPQMLSFDLEKDRLIRRYIFPNNALRSNSLLVTIVLDTINTNNNCAETYAYIADTTTYGLLVTNTKNGNTWRVQNNLFYPYPNWGIYNVAGQSFTFMDGVFALAMFPVRTKKHRRLYFHSLASVKENRVPTEILQNGTKANLMTGDFTFSRGNKPCQAGASAFDSSGILFFGLVNQTSLACWNSAKPHIARNIQNVAQDIVTLQFTSGLKVCNI